MPLPNYPYAGKDTLTKNDILETLQHWITVMQLKPGEKISDTEIAEYFNVSRTPVREVLKMLEQQKLIFTYPGRATIVADLALDDIESYYLPMQTLQCLAVRLAVEKADAADVEELERLNAEFGEVMENANDAESILMADKSFHERYSRSPETNISKNSARRCGCTLRGWTICFSAITRWARHIMTTSL